MLMSLKSIKGFSLIQVVVVAGIMGILSLIIVSMMQYQQRELRSVYEKMMTNDLKIKLQNIFKGNFCSCYLRGRTFDTTNLANPWSSVLGAVPNGYAQPVPAMPTPCTAVGAGGMIPAVGANVGNSSLKIKSIGMTDIIDQGSGVYSGNFVVGFDDINLVRGLKNISIPINVIIDIGNGTPTARPFLGCSGGIGDSIRIAGAVGHTPGAVTCPANYKMELCYQVTYSGDGQSMLYRQWINYTATSCSSNDFDGVDTGQIIGLCRRME